MTGDEKLPTSANTRLIGSLLIGLAAGMAAGFWGDTPLGILTSVCAAHAAFVGWGWRVLWPLDAAATKANACREDFQPSLEEFIVVAAGIGGLACIAMLLILGHSPTSGLAAAIALAAVFMSWASLNLMYSARYARLYYEDGAGRGIDFNQTEPPAYADFIYFSYNLGMTYQVSDTAVNSSRVRAIVLRHCLLSYVFGLVVLASTINVVAQIVSS